MVSIKINKNNFIPNSETLLSAFLLAVVASVVWFLITFFGLKPFFDFIPEGFELFTIVFFSVYLTKLFIVRLNGKEII